MTMTETIDAPPPRPGTGAAGKREYGETLYAIQVEQITRGGTTWPIGWENLNQDQRDRKSEQANAVRAAVLRDLADPAAGGRRMPVGTHVKCPTCDGTGNTGPILANPPYEHHQIAVIPCTTCNAQGFVPIDDPAAGERARDVERAVKLIQHVRNEVGGRVATLPSVRGVMIRDLNEALTLLAAAPDGEASAPCPRCHGTGWATHYDGIGGETYQTPCECAAPDGGDGGKE